MVVILNLDLESDVPLIAVRLDDIDPPDGDVLATFAAVAVGNALQNELVKSSENCI